MNATLPPYRTFSPSWTSLLTTYRGLVLAIRSRRLQHGSSATAVNRESLSRLQAFRCEHMVCRARA